MDSSDLIRIPCPLCGGSSTRYERTVRGFALERCRHCGMVFANPQYTQERMQHLYHDRDTDKLIQLYAQAATTAVLADIDRLLDEVEGILPGRGRILDFGCGPGYFFERAGQRGWDAHGIDYGSWVEKAAASRGLRNVHVGPLRDQGFSDGFFDVVCANQVLEHLAVPKDDLREIRRTIRPGGLFYASVPNYHCLSILLGRDDFELNEPPQHVNYFTPKSLCSLLNACDFEVLRVSTYGGLKWENLLGRPIESDIAAAYRNVESAPDGPPGNGKRNGSAETPFMKRMMRPLVKTLLYRMAKVGMCLEVFARKH
jgi:SAM-dependent methyltransferase